MKEGAADISVGELSRVEFLWGHVVTTLRREVGRLEDDAPSQYNATILRRIAGLHQVLLEAADLAAPIRFARSKMPDTGNKQVGLSCDIHDNCKDADDQAVIRGCRHGAKHVNQRSLVNMGSFDGSR